ncbi:hypothetical protein BT96DRAFT_1012099 [Gymnopus androsaceus JB14]|uniref:Uncharacterized protein n=1 Tax=Gymnopus androsaceus JB14 TaxID=1447944 RepID=A0A6A4IL38_9AGAR|nr:hypothetical protein BT96DRAFT_1012097 [Gymnopus androsaceus JB14]KAE9410593.1 hypothetical protein BT96DRAFT_1012099 [Gymnopus androsaceus JB14]
MRWHWRDAVQMLNVENEDEGIVALALALKWSSKALILSLSCATRDLRESTWSMIERLTRVARLLTYPEWKYKMLAPRVHIRISRRPSTFFTYCRGPPCVDAFRFPTKHITSVATPINARTASQGISVGTHTMGESLPRYLAMKIHPLVESSSWKNLIVVGRHDRLGSVIGREKTDKPFNWMRPTAKQVGDDLCIQCFPGEDHVEHYAALLAAHLRITQGADRARDVFYRPVPDGETIRTLREDTNLLRVPQADIVATGLVHRLGDLTGNARFEGGSEEEFGWVLKQFGDQKVLFLGCRFSFWGSISGDLPNRWLASGSTSTILGREVKWQNVLEPSLRGPDVPVIFGKHETLPSVLFETKNWLSHSTSFGHQFVDPEVGCMALAAVQSGIEFGYIHAISDNVASKYDEDLISVPSRKCQNCVSVRHSVLTIVGEVTPNVQYAPCCN